MVLHVFPIPIPPPTSLSIRSLWVFLVHQVRALVSFLLKLTSKDRHPHEDGCRLNRCHQGQEHSDLPGASF